MTDPESRTQWLEDGVWLTLNQRIRKVRTAIGKRRNRLQKSMLLNEQVGRIDRPADVRRWAAMRAEIAELESALQRLEAGEAVEASPKTGMYAQHLPDKLGQPDRADRPKRGAAKKGKS
jgi:hypothetical protein